MVWTQSQFPDVLDVFPRLVEGYHPDVSDDYDYIANAIWRIETVLGKDPRGNNSTIQDRLSRLVDLNGAPLNVVIVSVTTELSAIRDTGLGLTIFFPITFSSLNYTAVISCITDVKNDAGEFNAVGVDNAWITIKGTNSITIKAFQSNGNSIAQGETREITIGVLAIHETFTEDG